MSELSIIFICGWALTLYCIILARNLILRYNKLKTQVEKAEREYKDLQKEIKEIKEKYKKSVSL